MRVAQLQQNHSISLWDLFTVLKSILDLYVPLQLFMLNYWARYFLRNIQYMKERENEIFSTCSYEGLLVNGWLFDLLIGATLSYPGFSYCNILSRSSKWKGGLTSLQLSLYSSHLNLFCVGQIGVLYIWFVFKTKTGLFLFFAAA